MFRLSKGGNGNSDGSFNDAGNGGFWWSATERNASGAYYRFMSYSSANVTRGSSGKTILCSVRCVQD